MKKYILLVVLVIVAIACGNDDFNNNNRYLPNYSFQVSIDTDLPLYSQLKFVGNPVLVSIQGAGINGIFVTNTGSGFAAFEATCPNQVLSACSMLTRNNNSIIATCPCDGVNYNLFTGQPDGDVQYGLKPYRVQQVSESVLTISN